MNEDYNDIDKIFQDTFSQRQDEVDFNLPSDHMFENAMEVISNKEDKRKRRTILWLILGIAFILSVLSIYTITQIDTIKSKQNNVATLSDIEHVIDSRIKSNTENAKTNKASVTLVETNSPSEVSDQHNNFVQERAAQKQQASLQLQSSNQQFSRVVVYEELNAAPLQSMSGITSKKSTTHITPPISNLLLKEIERNKKVIINKQGWILPEKLDKKKRELYLSTRSQWTTFNMSDIQIKDAALTEYDRSYQGYSFGIGLNQEISKRWSLQIELGFNNIRNESKYAKDMLYDKSNEVIDPLNRRIYTTDITSFSPLIKDDFSLSGSVDHLDMKDLDIITQKSIIKNDLQYTYTRVIPMYRILNTNKWNWRIGLGGQFNVLVNTCEFNQTSLYKGSNMIIEGVHENTDKEQLKTVQVNLIASQELSYQLTHKIRLGIHGEFSKGLNTINKENTTSPGRTFSQGWSTGINLYYNL